jgi:hypothetical protein
MPAPGARPSNEDRIRAALWFAARGFGVFPVWSAHPSGTCRCPRGRGCDNPGKHPVSPRGFKDATTDPQRITTSLSAPSEPNYGLLCPEGVFVLDVDGEGVVTLERLEAEHGPLPPTLRTRTAHGVHVFLRWPVGLPQPIGQLFGFVTRWGAGHDLGYVIGPRSVHATGAVYAPAADTALEIAELPEAWAHAAVSAPLDDPRVLTIEGGSYRLPEHGYSGSRYGAILRYVASRYRRGLTADEVYAGMRAVLLPRFASPLSEEEARSRFERAWKGTPARLGEPLDAEEAGPAVAPEQDTDDWPEPPGEAAYHGVLGDIVRAVADHTEADPVAVLGSLLVMAGTCMGRWRIIYQGSPQAPNLFVVLVGDSSNGRKGTATSVGRAVMNAAYPGWERLIVAGLGSGEGLVGRFRGADVAEHRALVMESELGRLLTAMTREGSTLSPILRDAWDGVPMGRFLAREQALVTWHHVGLLAHVTPVELRQKLTNADAANGFGNRFLWLAVRRRRLIPFPTSPERLIAPFVEPLHDAIEAAQTPGELHWSAAAAEQWEWLYATLAMKPRHGLWGALLARAEAQIARLALLYALLDGAPAVDLAHLEAAEAVWGFGERSVVSVFGRSTGDRDADVLREYLADGPVEWEAAKKAIGVRRAADLTSAVETLRGLGLAEVVTVSRGTGRPRRLIRVPGANPAKDAADPQPDEHEEDA